MKGRGSKEADLIKGFIKFHRSPLLGLLNYDKPHFNFFSNILLRELNSSFYFSRERVFVFTSSERLMNSLSLEASVTVLYVG